MAKAISQATARSERLVDQLLLLARSEVAAPTRHSVELDRMVEQVLAELALEREDRSIQVHLALRPATPFVDDVLLHILVRNLIENAIRHNVNGGAIRIATAFPISMNFSNTPIPPAMLHSYRG